MPAVPSTRLQLVDEHKAFSFVNFVQQRPIHFIFRPALAQYVKDIWHLAERGFEYHVVAVFGSQSTGKSPSSSHYYVPYADHVLFLWTEQVPC